MYTAVMLLVQHISIAGNKSWAYRKEICFLQISQEHDCPSLKISSMKFFTLFEFSNHQELLITFVAISCPQCVELNHVLRFLWISSWVRFIYRDTKCVLDTIRGTIVSLLNCVFVGVIFYGQLVKDILVDTSLTHFLTWWLIFKNPIVCICAFLSNSFQGWDNR